MSAVQDPVKETPAVDPVATTTPEPTTATASDATADPVRPTGTDTLTPESRPEITKELDNATDTPATESGAVTGDKKGSKSTTVVESQPINEGVLNFKQPGLKGLIFSKKFFWFSEDAVEHKHLSKYLETEKPDAAHPTAAHATQTGKGLLFYAKRAEDKPQPAGILNLGEASDLLKGNVLDFTLKVRDHKYTFQAPSRAERDGWLVALETRMTEAKAAHEGLVGSEGYKSQLEKFAKPTGAVGATSTKTRSLSRPKKTTEEKKVVEDKPKDNKVAEDTALVAAAGTPAKATDGAASSSDEGKEGKSKKKSRSQSRKRGSIFGSLLAKKEEHDEKKEADKDAKKVEKEEKKEEKAEEKAIKQDVKKEEKAEKKAEKEAVKEAKKEEKVAEPEGSGKEFDAAAVASRVVGEPLVPSTDKESKEPIAAETAKPSTTEPTAEPGSDKAAKANKRGSIFGGLFAKKDATGALPKDEPSATSPTVKEPEPTAVSEAAPQLGDPVKESTSPVAEPATETTAPAAPAAPVAAPAEASKTATTPDATKGARRSSSFFGTLGGKKDKRSEATSDAEVTDGEGKKSTGVTGLFRKASRAVRGDKTTSESSAPPPPPPAKAATEETSEAPAPISKDAPATAEPITNGETATEQPATATTETSVPTASGPAPIKATA